MKRSYYDVFDLIMMIIFIIKHKFRKLSKVGKYFLSKEIWIFWIIITSIGYFDQIKFVMDIRLYFYSLLLRLINFNFIVYQDGFSIDQSITTQYLQIQATLLIPKSKSLHCSRIYIKSTILR